LPSEIVAAFLWAQLQHAAEITKKRIDIWHQYHDTLAIYEDKGLLRRPIVPEECTQNAHMYYILLNSLAHRTAVMDKLKLNKIQPVTHYVPLHNAPAGLKYGRQHNQLSNTENLADRLLRLPLWIGMDQAQFVCDSLFD
jgi:dTDP-4-amino-4,6-dideoxygalactose transaminase